VIRATPFDNAAALAVLRSLDPNDALEAQIARGTPGDPLDLWAEWRAAQPWAALSLVLRSEPGTPFALLAVARNPGAIGQGQAALLSRRHDVWRRHLSYAALRIRGELPGWAATAGLTRIEARCWQGHPTAAGFLSACGFHQEAALPGFGPGGEATFLQFAWTRERTDHVQDAES
jgi:hypothetical protein